MFTPVSHVTCQMSQLLLLFIFFRTKWWSLSVEGLLSTGPTPSSLHRFPTNFSTQVSNQFFHPIVPQYFSLEYFPQLFHQFTNQIFLPNLSTKCSTQFSTSFFPQLVYLIFPKKIHKNFQQIFVTSFFTFFHTFWTLFQHFSPLYNFHFLNFFLLYGGFCITCAVYWAIKSEIR